MNDINQTKSFDFPAVYTRVIFGFGVLSQLPAQVKNCGGGKAIIVSDPGLVRARVVESVVKTLYPSRKKYQYQGVQPNGLNPFSVSV